MRVLLPSWQNDKWKKCSFLFVHWLQSGIFSPNRNSKAPSKSVVRSTDFACCKHGARGKSSSSSRWLVSVRSLRIHAGEGPDIRCNIWERAKVRRDMTHSLSSRSSHNIGYNTFQWESVLHCDAGYFGKYSVLQVLPDKIGRFLFEYHCELYSSLNLPDLPADRSSMDVHSLLSPKLSWCTADFVLSILWKATQDGKQPRYGFCQAS